MIPLSKEDTLRFIQSLSIEVGSPDSKGQVAESCCNECQHLERKGFVWLGSLQSGGGSKQSVCFVVVVVEDDGQGGQLSPPSKTGLEVLKTRNFAIQHNFYSIYLILRNFRIKSFLEQLDFYPIHFLTLTLKLSHLPNIKLIFVCFNSRRIVTVTS